MGNDLAKADAVNTALANQRGRAAHDAVTGGLLPLPRRESLPASMGRVSGRDDGRHRVCYVRYAR